jgi:hypothetical protein
MHLPANVERRAYPVLEEIFPDQGACVAGQEKVLQGALYQ